MLLIFADARMPASILERLARIGHLIPFSTEGIVYGSISGHPDIFICPTPGGIIIAPNIPAPYRKILEHYRIPFTTGTNLVGAKYPHTALYNAVIGASVFIHNPKISDASIIAAGKESLRSINVKQGYAACNTCCLADNKFITSDRGIMKKLEREGYEVLFFDPSRIILPGVDHGFFGGACGVHRQTLYMAGSVERPADYEFRTFVNNAGCRLEELSPGPLFDGGGLLFVESELTDIASMTDLM